MAPNKVFSGEQNLVCSWINLVNYNVLEGSMEKKTLVCKRSDASVNYLMLKQLADASRPLVLVQLYVAFIFLKKGQVN